MSTEIIESLAGILRRLERIADALESMEGTALRRSRPPGWATYDGPIGPRPDVVADANTDGDADAQRDGGPIWKPKPSEGTSARLGLCGECGSTSPISSNHCQTCGSGKIAALAGGEC